MRRMGQYDFLGFLSEAPPEHCDDIPSNAVSTSLFEDIEGYSSEEDEDCTTEGSPEPWEVEGLRDSADKITPVQPSKGEGPVSVIIVKDNPDAMDIDHDIELVEQLL